MIFHKRKIFSVDSIASIGIEEKEKNRFILYPLLDEKISQILRDQQTHGNLKGMMEENKKKRKEKKNRNEIKNKIKKNK